MKNQNRSDGFLAIRDLSDEDKIKYSELLEKEKYKLSLTKAEKKFLKAAAAKGRAIREQSNAELFNKLFTEK